MKLKLTRSGGFMNKAVTAEEELNSHPAFLQDRIAQLFHNSIGDNTNAKGSEQNHRDNFQYFAEYDGRIVPLDVLENDGMLAGLVQRLKERLHY